MFLKMHLVRYLRWKSFHTQIFLFACIQKRKIINAIDTIQIYMKFEPVYGSRLCVCLFTNLFIVFFSHTNLEFDSLDWVNK